MAQQFASDNNAGLCPEALTALVEANEAGHAPAYGDDEWTERAREAVRRLLEAPDAAVHFVFNGTAANAIAMAHVCRPYDAVIAHESAHVATDEAGAPGFFSGGAILRTADGAGGKLTPADVERLATGGRGVHSSRPRLVTLAQATEAGTVYRPAEMQRIAEASRRLGLVLHMDGARLANAVAHLECAPADVTWRAGIDILSLGGVKNGLAFGEALVVFDPERAREIEWRIKQSGHLNSKMRLMTAPWVRLIESGAWLVNARHANAMAVRLASCLADAPGLRIVHPVEANAVFVEMSAPVQAAVRARGWRFYTFAGEVVCRLMCAWDTSAETVDRFASDIAAAAAARP
jgi:threonine aldolase